MYRLFMSWKKINVQYSLHLMPHLISKVLSSFLLVLLLGGKSAIVRIENLVMIVLLYKTVKRG